MPGGFTSRSNDSVTVKTYRATRRPEEKPLSEESRVGRGAVIGRHKKEGVCEIKERVN